MKKTVTLVLSPLLVTVLSVPLARAESSLVAQAAQGASADAHLDFSIVVQATLFLRVGTSAGNTATDGGVDALTFTVPATQVGDGTVISGSGGDLAAGAATVRVYGNGGSISLNSVTTGPLASATGDTVSWSQIGVSASALPGGTAGFTNGAIPHPSFNTGPAGGNGTATTLEAASKVVRLEGRWTYSYLNGAPVRAGTYGSTPARNGRVTYTATQL